VFNGSFTSCEKAEKRKKLSSRIIAAVIVFFAMRINRREIAFEDTGNYCLFNFNDTSKGFRGKQNSSIINNQPNYNAKIYKSNLVVKTRPSN
jgi:hypothetical protein